MATNNYLIQEEDQDIENSLSSPWFHIDLRKVKVKDVPTNGEEFLASVIAERKKICSLKIRDEDRTNLNKNQSEFVEEIPVASAPNRLKPTIEWQNIQVADFSDVRMHVSRMLANSNDTKNIKNVHVVKDNLAWWTSFFEKKEPTLSCVLGLNSAKMDRALVMLTTILEKIEPGETIDYKMGKWIYSILACRKQPLISDTISILRDLARQCALIRSHINPEKEDALNLATPLNVIICLVGRYFRQYDLAD